MSHIIYKRLMEPENEALYTNFEDGLDLLRNGRYVLYLHKERLCSYFKNHPFKSQNIKYFQISGIQNVGIVLPKNSPLTPVLKYCFLRLNEAGAKNILNKKWFGDTIPKVQADERVILSISQVILIFLFISVAIGISLFLLFGEMVAKKCIKSRCLDRSRWLEFRLVN